MRRFRSAARRGCYSDAETGSAIVSPPFLVDLWTCFPKPVTGEIAKSARKAVILTDRGRSPAHELLVWLAFGCHFSKCDQRVSADSLGCVSTGCQRSSIQRSSIQRSLILDGGFEVCPHLVQPLSRCVSRASAVRRWVRGASLQPPGHRAFGSRLTDTVGSSLTCFISVPFSRPAQESP